MLVKRGKWQRPSLDQRFAARFIPEPNSGCWLWAGKLNPYGYGVIQKNGGGWVLAHRISAAFAGMNVHPRVLVCHRCDNRACVNPAHLFVGTHADNSRDMTLKGRSTRGEKNPRSRLTHEAAAAIQKDTITPAEDLARRYGVAAHTIRACRRRHTWRHV